MDAEGTRIGLLGSLQVTRQGRTALIAAPKHRSLLAVLAINLNRPVPVERIIQELWSDSRVPKYARKTVQGYIWRLRADLEDALVTRGDCYELVGDPHGMVDSVCFEELVRTGRTALLAHRLEEAEVALGSAMALWRGPALADVPLTPTLVSNAVRLTELRLGVLENLIEVEIRSGRHQDVIPTLHELAAENPLHEGFRSQLMLALFRAGRQAEALSQYGKLRARSVSELGMELGTAVQRLHQQILAGDPILGRAPVGT